MSSFLRPAWAAQSLWHFPANPWILVLSLGSSLGNDTFLSFVWSFAVLCEVAECHFLPLNFSKRQTTHYSGVLRQILTPDTSDMQTVHFSICAAMRLYRSCCSSFRLWNASPVTLHLCPQHSRRFTQLLKHYLSCSSSSGSKINHGFREIITVSPILECWHGKGDGQTHSNQGCNLGKPY